MLKISQSVKTFSVNAKTMLQIAANYGKIQVKKITFAEEK
jgi:hypothetical protein